MEDKDELVNYFEAVTNFGEEMMRMITGKREKFHDLWKSEKMRVLKERLEKQLDEYSYLLLLSKDGEKKIYIPLLRRKLIHMANYCLFMHEKLVDKQPIEK